MISRFTLAAFLMLLLAEFPTAGAEDGAPSTAAGMQRLVNRVLQVRSDSPGICAVLGWDDQDFLIRLAKSSDLLIHAIDSDQELVAATQKEVDAAGLYGRRVVIERAEWQQLPYSNDMIDLVVAVHLETDDLERLPAAEVLRTLRPLGVAIIGGSAKTDEGTSSLSKSELKEWLKQAGVENVEPEQNDQGLFVVITKPALEGADDWSHWEHGPDNNPVSVDEVIRAPYMTKWLGTPYYISMPAITTAAGGRLFNAIGHIAHHKREEPWLNTLLARNGYNGTILWSRKLPDGYLVHRSAFIATDDVFYMIDTDGSGCLMLDPETGDELGRLNIPGTRGQWKWMAIKNGVLFGLVGDEKDPAETTIVRSERSHWSWGELSKGYYEDRVPWGFGKRVFAYDLKKEERLWDHEEEQLIDSRSMVIGDDRLYLYSPDARLASLDSRTGYVVWTNEDTDVQKLIEQPGQGLASTPGFRSMTYCVHTPEALIYQAQTRANVVSISTKDGSLLWTKPKTTNNPNALFIDQKVALGIGENGTTLMVDPASGEVSDNLEFTKRSCARLTATADSLFCRGWPEGLTRYDRKTGKVSFNGAFRPACNDGVIAANGLAYLGPWPCDCNLMLLGRVAMTSAGDFDFSQPAVEAERLQTTEHTDAVAALDESESDWWTYRSGIDRSASTDVSIANSVSHIWEFAPPGEVQSTATTTAGGFVFVGASDGSVRAIDAASGRLQWSYLTAGPILHPPTIWQGRAYIGSGDGYVYALEAATGELLWKFRAAPVERRIPLYGSLSSTWPVHSGVLVSDGVVYCAAGIIDQDGTYVYALDAKTGRIKWQNTSSGHLDPELRKGVSAHGDLTIADGRLWMPGGNIVSPAAYDLETGEYVGSTPGDGSPKSNRGEEIGTFRDHTVIVGGRLRFAPMEDIVNPGQFDARVIGKDDSLSPPVNLHQGQIPPAWSDEYVLMVDGRLSVPACYTADAIEDFLSDGTRPKPIWTADTIEGTDVVSLALTKNAALMVYEVPQIAEIRTQWVLVSLDLETGKSHWEQALDEPVQPGSLTIDRDGRILLTQSNGHVLCFGDGDAVRENIKSTLALIKNHPEATPEAAKLLVRTLKTSQGGDVRRLALSSLQELGIDFDGEARRNGALTRWMVVGPFPFNTEHDADAKFLGEPNVDVANDPVFNERTLSWWHKLSDNPNGMIDLAEMYGRLVGAAAYGYAEFELDEDREMLLQIGSNDGFLCWLNGEFVGRFDGQRAYAPDQNVLEVTGKRGKNRILLKITQAGSRWAFGVRLTDPDGQPIEVKHPEEAD